MPASVLDEVRSAGRLITRRGEQRNRSGDGRSWIPPRRGCPGKRQGFRRCRVAGHRGAMSRRL